MTQTRTLKIIEAINSLPSEKADAVEDYVMFLCERYGRKEETETIDYSDEWSDEDLRDLSIDTFHRVEKLENGVSE